MADDIPQWKKDLIARLRNQNKWSKNFITPHQTTTTSTTSSSNHKVQQPNNNNNNITNGTTTTNNTPSLVASVSSSVQHPSGGSHSYVVSKMVQERVWLENMVNNSEIINNKQKIDDDSDEDLRYGPGIVSKLKNKYLSLALRENNAKQRPSILNLRKAASLENLIDENDSTNTTQTQQTNNLYKKPNKQPVQPKTQRYNRPTNRTEMKRARSVETISRNNDDIDKSNEEIHKYVEGNDKTFKKQTEIKYTRINRPKRIQPIMNEKEKPPIDVVKQTKLIFERRPEQRTRAPPTTGDVAAKIDSFNNIIVKSKVKIKPPIVKTKPSNLTIKPKSLDLVGKSPLTSPIPDISKIGKENTSLCETPDLILTSSPINNGGSNLLSPTFRKTTTETFLNEERYFKQPPPSPVNKITFDEEPKIVNKNISNVKTPPTQQLKIDTNNFVQEKQQQKTPSPPSCSDDKILTTTEIEKNRINNVKNGENSDVKKFQVPKKPKTTYIEPTTAVFNFTNRKDVPDYISNDQSRTATRPSLPKPGEGGIILISGASITESFTDEDEEIMRSLECPPSPCDVAFVNDNILIDGKSSLSQKTKRAKMRISFVDAGPEVFEYPSETSLLLDDTNNSQVGHTVPNLSGSTLANYTPKSTEDFQPGITQRTTQQQLQNNEIQDVVLEEIDEPILFSAGTNSDILF